MERLVVVSGVANLQVSQLQQWARNQDLRLEPVSATEGSNEWTCRVAGEEGDVQAFLSDPDLPRCKGRQLTVVEAAKELMMIEAFCDEIPLQGWLSGYDIAEDADVQLDWELLEDRTVPTPFVFKVQSGLEDLTKLAQSCMTHKKPGSREKTAIRFRAYHRPTDHAPVPPHPSPPPPQPAPQTPPGLFEHCARAPRRIIIVHDSKTCPIPPVQPQLRPDGGFLMVHDQQPVLEEPKVIVEFDVLYDVVLRRIVSLTYNDEVAKGLDLKTVEVEWQFIYVDPTPSCWKPSPGSLSRMSQLRFNFQRVVDQVGALDAAVQRGLQSVADEWQPKGRAAQNGLVVALLSGGSRDCVPEVQALRAGDPFPTCMLCPAGQATSYALQMAFPRVDHCWERLVHMSRSEKPRRGPSRSGGVKSYAGGPGPAYAGGPAAAYAAAAVPRTSASAASASAAASSTTTRAPSCASGGTVEIPLKFEMLRFFSNSKHLQELESHFFQECGLILSGKVTYEPKKLLVLSPATVDVSPRDALGTPSGGLPMTKVAIATLGSFIDVKVLRDEVEVQGLEPSEVIKDNTLNFLANKNKVVTFVPGASKTTNKATASHVTLRQAQLFLSFNFGGPAAPSSWDEAKVKECCLKHWQIAVWSMEKIHGHHVVTLDFSKCNLTAAKRTLVTQRKVPQLKFSETASVHASTTAPTAAAAAASVSPSPSSPAGRRLERNKLFFYGVPDREELNQRVCSSKKVFLESLELSPQPGGAAVATFSATGDKSLEEARKTLLDLGARYKMQHPKEWTDDQVKAFLRQEGLDKYKYQLQGGLNFEQTVRFIFFRDVAVFEKLRDWEIKDDVSFDLAHHFSEVDHSPVTKKSTVVLLTLSSRGGGGEDAALRLEKVKQAFERKGTAERVFWLPSSASTNEDWAKRHLVQQTIHRLRSKFTARDLKINFNKSEGQLYVKGNAGDLRDIEPEMQQHLQNIKVKIAPYLAPKQESGYTWNDATHKTILTFLQGPSRPDRQNRIGHGVDNKTAAIVLCWWQEDEDTGVLDLLEELERKLESFCRSYTEQEWRLADVARDLGETEDQIWERLRRRTGDGEGGVEKLCEDLGVKELGVLIPKWSKEAGLLSLCGHGEAVAAAKRTMTRYCQRVEPVTRQLALPRHLPLLLEHKKNKDQLQALHAVYHGLDVEVTLDESLVLRGEAQFVEQASSEVMRWLNGLRIVETEQPLSHLQTTFLLSDTGKMLLEKIQYETATCTSLLGQLGPQPQSKRLVTMQLPNKVLVEVWTGNILTNEPRATALVNSANKYLLKPNVGGIAGAIKRAAGQDLTDDCTRIVDTRGPLPVGTVEATRAYALSQSGFECILHAVPPKDPCHTTDMQVTVRRILQAAVTEGTSAVVLPLLGTGIYRWKTSTIASLFFRAMAEWVREDPVGALQRIVVMDSNAEKCREFVAAMCTYDEKQDEEAGGERAEPEFDPPPAPQFKWEWRDHRRLPDGSREYNWVTYDYDQCLDLDDIYADLLRSPMMSVTRMLLGDRQGAPSLSINVEDGEQNARYDVEMQLDEAGSLKALQRNRKSNWPRPIRKTAVAPANVFAEIPMYQEKWNIACQGHERVCAEHKQRSAMARPAGVERWFTPVKEAASSNSADGLAFSALLREHCEEAKVKLTEALQNAECTEFKTYAGALQLSEDVKVVRQHFEAVMAARLQEDFPLLVKMEASGPSGLDLDVTLTAVGQNNLMIGTFAVENWLRERENKILEEQAEVKFPGNWRSVDDNADECLFMEVPPDSDEFREVVQLMRDETGLATKETARRNIFTAEILEVHQCINRPLWRKYYRFCQELPDPNEVWVKHGTGRTDPTVVCEAGFNRGYSKPDERNLWGVGIYTAENAAYSDEGYVKSENTNRQMLLCKFAAGKAYQPKAEDYKKDPTRPECATKEPPKGYDSIRGIVKRTKGNDYALISYQDSQIYPFYLVTYGSAA